MQTSYDKIRYTHTIEVAKSIVCYKETDLATFFIVQEDELSIIDKIWLRDLYNIILNEINQLPHPDNKIGKLVFIDELNDTQIAKYLTSTNYCYISKEDNSKTNSRKTQISLSN